MPPTNRKVPVEPSQSSVASVNMSQAFIGLYLHENLEIAEALEFFVRGYIGCATDQGLDYVPPACAEKALTTFAHHGSWGHNGFPWDRLDRDWKTAAMNKLVSHVHRGHSLAEQPADDVSLPDNPQVAKGGGRVRPSFEEASGEPNFLDEEGSVSVYNDQGAGQDDEGQDNPDASIGPLLIKGKTAVPTTSRTTLPASQRLALPYELPSSISESPSQLAALNRARNNSSVNPASSSSPLSTLPSSLFKSCVAARTNNDPRQTRSVTRVASSRSGTPGSSISVASSRQSVRLQEKRKQKQAMNADEMLWPFIAILDSRVKGDDIEYRIKWTKGKPTWQPSLDLRDTSEEIGAFHEKYPAKVGPPRWFTRRVAKAEVDEDWVEERVNQSVEAHW